MKTQRKELQACRKTFTSRKTGESAECVDGWLKRSDDKMEACRCRREYIRVVKAQKAISNDLASAAIPTYRDDAEQANWADHKRFLQDADLPSDMTPQELYAKQNPELLKNLVAKLAASKAMDAQQVHPKAKELLKLRKQGIVGKQAYKLLDTSPSGRSYKEYFREDR
jgi:uncharacterized protein YdaU (DUF1376 family)